ncbi:hypothetical protein PHYBLDRAFT_63988 [Phycomyces blakesleeanus NRRL 1555(-)]|uniref:Transposase domain-containing protein n=1 Tax=Phycomyces blakesleeanus (strain ATCC 8743b / DSM 1359 / FGSC 10004 / NBRC 33097 / NRRL 1555) TaxID=763407 RepID=A0A162TYY1_PHYB8|nr:hypothetical protein PHYBLDRAFT_63988 [Phycomyces blakesleeanus NRRL 1555(-)]OAD70943.1 hypothetical protein PHYBLDRAFT_63988 [Phycomyces blakesleeanus NRRL 1555(-)]|eukprot:XP_018288983.1 hypothetical protein PHYBLDRAFT_63988 [Phycomyces blakesleeanus NRRL 1555(-)]
MYVFRGVFPVICPSGVRIHATLMMVACDIPAARKTSGFTSHNSTWACYKCNRHFPRLENGVNIDFRGFDFSRWVLRDGLHRLGYLDLVRGTIIDPMHNLFLGTPKRLMDRWIKDEDIQDGDFVAMQKTAETMIVPGEYTSLNSKIGKQFSYMKADEWKSWVLVYSPVLLKDVLAKDRFENWINFVDACRLLIKPTITFNEVNTAHQFLQTFCTRCDELYNAEILTCNMHLHLHLRDTIRDFGPVYGYWLFGFERFNGLLKNLKTNRKIGFEETFMKKFIEDVHKDDLVNSFLQSTHQTSAFSLLTKLTYSFTPATIPSIRQRTFRIQSFVEASEDPNVLVKGNEPLPPSAFPLSLKSATTMIALEKREEIPMCTVT